MAVTEIAPAPRKTRRPKRSGTPAKIRMYREAHGLSPEQFGARVGLSGMTIRRIEDGRAKASSLLPRTKYLIASEMGLTVHDLWPL